MESHYMQDLDWLILGIYFAVLIGIGIWASTKRKKEGSLFLAEHSLRWHHIGFSMWGTNVGPSMLIASASAGFTTGIVSGNYAWYAFVFIALLAFVFAPRYLGANISTLPEFMGLRFGQSTRNILAWYTIITVIISWLALTLFAGGVLIMLLKPYKVGDFIEAQGFAGTVREIQIFSTILGTPDNQTVIIPNGPLATGSLKNSTKAPTRRVDIDVEVAYGTAPDAVRKVLMDIITADERIMQSGVFAPFIPMTSMGSSSLTFQMRIWVKAPDFWNVKFETTEKIYRQLGEAGIEIPFQQMDVHIK